MSKRHFDVDRVRSSSRYQRVRNTYLRLNPLCRLCEKQGRTVAAKELDHIVPVLEAPERFWHENNWQPLCRKCHEAKTARENHGANEWKDYLKETYGTD